MMPGEGAFMNSSLKRDFIGADKPLVARDLGVDRGGVAILQLADRLRRVEHLAVVRNARQHPLRELRKLDEFLAERPLRHAAETIHALRDVGLEADTRLLAVIGAVDAHLRLFREHVGDARIHERVEAGPVDRVAAFLVEEHGAERLAARDAAGMRRQDAVDTALHRGPPDSFPERSRR